MAGAEAARPVRALVTPVPWGQRESPRQWAAIALFLKEWGEQAPDVALVDERQASAVLSQVFSDAFIRREGTGIAAVNELLPVDLCIVVGERGEETVVTIHRDGLPDKRFSARAASAAPALLTDVFDWLSANVPAFDPACAPFERAFIAKGFDLIADVYIAPRLISHWTAQDVSTGDARWDRLGRHLAFLGVPQMRRAALAAIRGYDGDGRSPRNPGQVAVLRELALLHSLGTAEEAEAIDVCAGKLGEKETGARLARWMDAFDPDAMLLGALAAGTALKPGGPRQEGAVAIYALEKPSAAQVAGAIRCFGAMGLATFGERIAKVASWVEPLPRIAAVDYFAAFQAPFGDEALRALAGDRDPAVAFAAVRARMRRGAADDRLLPLARRLWDAGTGGKDVIETLAEHGTAEDGARLRQAATAPESLRRLAAARGLLRLGLDLPEHWDVDPSSEVLIAILAGLPSARAAGQRAPLLGLCNHPRNDIAEMARMAAAPLRPEAGDARDLFELETEHPYIRQRLVRMWGRAGDEAAVRNLTRAAANRDPNCRALAILELARCHPAAARLLLERGLRDPHRTVRLYAAVAAERCAEAADLALLETALADQPDTETRLYLEDAIARLKGRPAPSRRPVHTVSLDRCMTFSCVMRETSRWDGFYLLGLPADIGLLRRQHYRGAVILPRANRTAHIPKQVLLDPVEADRFWLGLDAEFGEVWDCMDGLVLGEESMSFSPLWEQGWRLFCRDMGIDPTRVAGLLDRLDERERMAWSDWSMRMNIEGFNHMVAYIRLRYGKRRPGFQIATFRSGEGGPTDYDHLWEFDISAHYAYAAPSRVRYLCIRRLRTTWPDRPMIWLNQGKVGAHIALNAAEVTHETRLPARPVHSLASVSAADTLVTWMAGAHNGLWSVYAFGPSKYRSRGGGFLDIDAFFPDNELFARTVASCFEGVEEARLEQALLGDAPVRPETSLVDAAALPTQLEGILEADATATTKARVAAEVAGERAAFRNGLMVERFLITETFQRFSGLPFPDQPREVLLVGPLQAPGFDIAGDCDFVGRITHLDHMPLTPYRMICFSEHERIGPADTLIRLLSDWLRKTPGVLYVHRWIPDGPDAGRVSVDNPMGVLTESWPWTGDLIPRTEATDKRDGPTIRGYRPVARTETLAKEGDAAVLALWRHPDYRGVVLFDTGAAGAARVREVLADLRAREGIGATVPARMGMVIERDDLYGHVYFGETLPAAPPGTDVLTGIRDPVVPPGRTSTFIARRLNQRYLFADNGIAVIATDPLLRADSGEDRVTVVSDGILRVVADATPVFEREGGGPLPVVEDDNLLPWLLESDAPGVARIATKDQEGVSWLIRAQGGLTIRKTR